MQYDFKIQTPFEFWSHIFNFSYQLVLEMEASNCSTIKKNHLDFVVRFRHFYRILITRSVLQRESPYKKPSTLKWVLITFIIQNFTYPHQTCSHSFLDINQQIPLATLPVSFMSLGNLKVDSSPIRLYFYLAAPRWHMPLFCIFDCYSWPVSIATTGSLVTRKFFFFFFDSFLIVLKVSDICWCTNFCLNVSIFFNFNYLGWHELSNIDKCVSSSLVCSFVALLSSLFISFSDFLLYQTTNFIQVLRNKFWFFTIYRSEEID